MLPTHANDSHGAHPSPRRRRRQLPALFNHGNIRRLVRSHSKLLSVALPALLLISVLSVMWFFSRLSSPEAGGVGGPPQSQSSTVQRAYGEGPVQRAVLRSHQAMEQEDWGYHDVGDTGEGNGGGFGAGIGRDTRGHVSAAVGGNEVGADSGWKKGRGENGAGVELRPVGPAGGAAPRTRDSNAVADAHTLADDHPWLAQDTQDVASVPLAAVIPNPPLPNTPAKTVSKAPRLPARLPQALHEDAVKLADAERIWMGKTEDTVRKDVHVVESEVTVTLHAIDSGATVVAEKVEKAVGPIETEVATVGAEVEQVCAKE
jgi:hypothetical protein|eukprot:SAG25_NODE_1215_length_3590_cov_6.991979_1_plen_317_part_00